ncbi:MAG: transcriptional regulator [Bacteroidetes bacterium CG12_big_fil_rev_8_21_14_0_65_60_17]|nr:MAG: transcriptional regulator [Bacteroidetes bacterium CG12_big_fil_rev_8_21_14_0_65_60_17]
MTLAGVKRIAARGEGRHIEFKLRVPRPERMAREMIAFANSGGGTLLVGVDDDGSIVGVKDVEEEEFSIRHAVGLHCRPVVKWRSYRVPVSRSREVIVITVPASKYKPHFMAASSSSASGPAYVRVEDRSMEASPETVELLRTEGHEEGVFFELGEREMMLFRYLEQYGHVTAEGWAQVANLPRHEAGDVLVTMTRAGVLTQHRQESGEYFTLHMAE